MKYVYPNQPTNQPPPRKTLGALLVSAARIGMAGAEGAARRGVPAGGGGRATGGCTPCAAMARKNAAVAARKAAGG